MNELHSIERVVTAAFPKHHWEAWKFVNSRSSKSDSPNSTSIRSNAVKSLVEKLAQDLKIQNLEEWYNITPNLVPLDVGTSQY